LHGTFCVISIYSTSNVEDDPNEEEKDNSEVLEG
jgi:hypothetical protein